MLKIHIKAIYSGSYGPFLCNLKTSLKEQYLEENWKSSCFSISNLNIKYVRKHKSSEC